MEPSAQMLRRASASGILLARLCHTLFVLCSTSLMLAIALFSFLLLLLIKCLEPKQAPPSTSRHRGGSGRHVKFLEPSIVIPSPSATAAAAGTAASASASAASASASAQQRPPSLSLMATPRALLEPPTPDVAEDPLRALSRICGFLASNTARAWRRDELGPTPPLAGLEPYLGAVRGDLARIDEMVAEGGSGPEEDDEGEDEEGGEEGEAVGGAAAAGEAESGGHASTPSTPTPEPTAVQSASSSSSSSSPSPPIPHPTDTIAPIPIPIPTLTPTPSGARRRKDAVLRPTRPSPSADPKSRKASPQAVAVADDAANANANADADADADADDASVRAAALLSRVAGAGAGLLEGTVRERGAALWAVLSRRSTTVTSPPDADVWTSGRHRAEVSASYTVYLAKHVMYWDYGRIEPPGEHDHASDEVTGTREPLSLFDAKWRRVECSTAEDPFQSRTSAQHADDPTQPPDRSVPREREIAKWLCQGSSCPLLCPVKGPNQSETCNPRFRDGDDTGLLWPVAPQSRASSRLCALLLGWQRVGSIVSIVTISQQLEKGYCSCIVSDGLRIVGHPSGGISQAQARKEELEADRKRWGHGVWCGVARLKVGATQSHGTNTPCNTSLQQRVAAT
ncbi:hypothetical protein BJV74DRAFT_796627 [Russula compacta]|nr:hypothetical protein BJV74DRAFT_796627 [Russula compacta]